LNLLDLCNGVATRFPSKSLLAEGTANAQPPKINVQITIVDERDGFCKAAYIPSVELFR
jgi:hypothetical protein